MQWLLAKKPEIISRYSFLPAACLRGKADMVAMLISAGASLDGKSAGRTAIEIAAETGRWDIVKIILTLARKTTKGDEVNSTLMLYGLLWKAVTLMLRW